MMRVVLMAGLLSLSAIPFAAAALPVEAGVYHGQMIVKSLDARGLIVAVQDSDSDLVSDVFVYRTSNATFGAHDLKMAGRVITNANGMVIVSRSAKLAYVLSLDAPADQGLGLDLEHSGFTVIRATAGVGFNHVPHPSVTMEQFDRGDRPSAHGIRSDGFGILYHDYDWGSGGGPSCGAGGPGATSCSVSCPDQTPDSCSVSCAKAFSACCGCGSSGASCGCY